MSDMKNVDGVKGREEKDVIKLMKQSGGLEVNTQGRDMILLVSGKSSFFVRGCPLK